MLDKPDILSIIKAAGFQPIRRGSRLFILCPFHPDKNPSCLINTERQIFHCFACSAHGDVIDFVMELKGFSFPEACDYLRIKSKGSSNRSNKAKRKIKRLTPEEKFHVEFAHLLRLRNEVVFRAAFDEWLTNRLSFLSEIIDKLERTLEAISEFFKHLICYISTCNVGKPNAKS